MWQDPSKGAAVVVLIAVAPSPFVTARPNASTQDQTPTH